MHSAKFTINNILIPPKQTSLQNSATIYAQATIIYVLIYTTQNQSQIQKIWTRSTHWHL